MLQPRASQSAGPILIFCHLRIIGERACLWGGTMTKTVPPDGCPLWIMERPVEGWSKKTATDVDEAVERFARRYGREHLHLWLSYDAWNRMALYLRHNERPGQPEVTFEAPPKTKLPKAYLFYKADPSAQRPRRLGFADAVYELEG